MRKALTIGLFIIIFISFWSCYTDPKAIQWGPGNGPDLDGGVGGDADGDADGDEDVDIDDYTILKALFGNTGGLRMSNPDEPWPIVSPEIWEVDIIEAVAPVVVPEPASVVLLGLAGAALLRRRD